MGSSPAGQFYCCQDHSGRPTSRWAPRLEPARRTDTSAGARQQSLPVLPVLQHTGIGEQISSVQCGSVRLSCYECHPSLAAPPPTPTATAPRLCLLTDDGLSASPTAARGQHVLRPKRSWKPSVTLYAVSCITACGSSASDGLPRAGGITSGGRQARASHQGTAFLKSPAGEYHG